MSKKQIKNEEIGKKKGQGKKIFLIILLIIFVPIIIFFGYRFISNKLDDMNTKKMSNTINKISKDRIDYVFIEINPSFVLTIKENKVNDIACLNDDCVSIYNDIDVKGKSIGDSIDSLYNLAKEKGFDTSKGVKVKTTISLNFENKDYISIEFIDEISKQELLSNIKNNEEIKNNSNDDYYTKLWEELKKDKDYDNVYSCKMNDNKKLECYISFDNGVSEDLFSENTEHDDTSIGILKSQLTNASSKVFNTLKKFNFDVKDNAVYINGYKYEYTPSFSSNGVKYQDILISNIVEKIDDGLCKELYDYNLIAGDGKCEFPGGEYIIPLNSLELVSQSTNNLIDNRAKKSMKESILQQYEMMKEFNR